MKKLVTAVLTAALAVTSTSFAFAAPEELANAVTVDGKVDGAEWDDANEIVMNADTENISWANAVTYTADEFSVTMKMKWDENNLYILQQRKDVKFIPETDPKTPWGDGATHGDGTMVFLTTDTANTGRADICFIVDEAGTAVREWSTGTGVAKDTDWQIATTLEGDVHTTEVVVPWADLNDVVTTKFDVKEGAEFTFTPIMPNTNDTFGQMHYNVETGKGADDPTAWASFKLVAAKAGAGSTGDSSNTTTPPTGDNFGAIIAAGVIGAAALTAGVLAVSKKKSK